MTSVDVLSRYLFFTGKGGVGKTSLSCATALRLAESGRRVLIVSTDPASNLDEVLETSLGSRAVPVSGVAGLLALNIDPEVSAREYRERMVAPYRGILPAAAIASMEEQFSGACTVEIAAFDEFAKLLGDPRSTAEFNHVIFDTAPTGHTLRLLTLPSAWSGFIASSTGGASCLGPLAGLEKQRSQYQQAVAALADGARTRLVLVARAQQSTLREAARTHDELRAIGLGQQYLVVNGVFPPEEAAQDPLAAAICRREQAVLRAMPPVLQALPIDVVALKPFNLVGLDALRQLLVPTALAPEAAVAADGLPQAAIDAPSLSSLVNRIAADGHGLVMLMGKGGVGKTTLAAAVAVELAHRGLPVHLTTSDPAEHLVETLGGALDNLTVSRIDPHEVTERYRQKVLDSKGATLDAAGRALLEEDLRSPCTEEIAVFQAFSRVIREAGSKFVVMDTAPTGHTLLLLDATGAYHRDTVRQMGSTGVHFTTPLMQLQDPKQTKVVLVALAETTPVLEAAHLQDDLRRAGIEPWAWVINNSVAAAHVTSPLLRQRARNELREIDAVATQHATRHAIVPLLSEEPVGVQRLLQLAGADTSSAEV